MVVALYTGIAPLFLAAEERYKVIAETLDLLEDKPSQASPPINSLLAQHKEKTVNENFDLTVSKKSFGYSEKDAEIFEDSGNDLPDWLKRTSYGIIIESGQKMRCYFETVQPLYQSADKIHTFFTHDRVSVQDGRGAYSAGFGYRRLLLNENLLAGINGFFDYQDLHKHYRSGLGLELIAKTLEFRLNSYFALSPRRLVEESGTTKIYEKAVNGGDVELGGPIPYLPWFKMFGSYYRYDFRKFKDMTGWKVRGEITPFEFIKLNLETYDDNKGRQEYRMDVRFNFAFHDFSLRSLCFAFKLPKEPYPDIDLKEKTLVRVERNFNIQVEKWSDSGNIIEIKRGN